MPIVVLQPDATNGKDTHINQNIPTANNGASTLFYVGELSDGTYYRALIQFDVSSIPSTAIINSAVVSLMCTTEDNTGDYNISFYRALAQWYEGSKVGAAPDAGTDGSTWNQRNANGPLTWPSGPGGAASGADRPATATATTVVSGSGARFEWNVTADVQNFVNGTYTNNGWWILKDPVTSVFPSSRKHFASSDNATAADRPMLTIDYSPFIPDGATSQDLQPGPATAKDTFINSFAGTNNYGASTTIQAGLDTSSGGIRRGLLQFDLSALPLIDSIHSATLSLYCISEVGTGDFNFKVHRALSDWHEGVSNGAVPGAGVDASTWNNQNHNGTDTWAGGAGGGSGSDYAATETDTALVSATSTWYTWDVTADVQDWTDLSAPNYGWFIKGDEAAVTSSQKSFVSADDAARPEFWPILTVVYFTEEIGGTSDGFATASAHLIGDLRIGGNTGNAATTSAKLIGRISIAGVTGGVATATALVRLGALLHGSSDGFALTAASMQALAVSKKFAEICESTPLLYITDGSYLPSGQLDMLDLLSTRGGFLLNEWIPAIAQYKDGGYFSDSITGGGRRLARRMFDNAIEVMTLSLKSDSQDRAIFFTREYLRWQELAADYWTSDWSTRPVYLVARAARETKTRYAIIHVMSIPSLGNPYSQPFFNSRGQPAMDNLALRIEREPWTDVPPGVFDPVPLSSIRSWTVAGWEVG